MPPLLTMRVSAKVLKVPLAASLRWKALAHSLTMRTRSGNRESMLDRWRSTVDLKAGATAAHRHVAVNACGRVSMRELASWTSPLPCCAHSGTLLLSAAIGPCTQLLARALLSNGVSNTIGIKNGLQCPSKV